MLVKPVLNKWQMLGHDMGRKLTCQNSPSTHWGQALICPRVLVGSRGREGERERGKFKLDLED